MTADEIIHEKCKPYGGFVNVINKCGGSTVMMIMRESCKQYAAIESIEFFKWVSETMNDAEKREIIEGLEVEKIYEIWKQRENY